MSLKIKFTNFWGGFDASNFLITKLLNECNVAYEIANKGEDVHIFSVFGKKKDSSDNCKLKLCYSGEPVFDHPNADYVIGFLEDGNRLIQIRNFERCYYESYGKKDVYSSLKHPTYNPDRKFCLFAVSNPACKIRNDFFLELTKYKHVDSIGKVYNNMQCDVRRQDAPAWEKFISGYNFMITFENGSHPHYITEKLYNAMRAGITPIYWGSYENPFNKGSFIEHKPDDSWSNTVATIQAVEESYDRIDFSKFPYVHPKSRHNLDKLFEENCQKIVDIIANVV